MKKIQKAQVEAMAYQFNISFDPRDDIYVVRIPELENCHSHGKSPEEALKNGRIAVELWLASARKAKRTIPEPLSQRKFSGKFLVRTPEELHASLAKEAQLQGKSMNELAVELLRKGIKKAG